MIARTNTPPKPIPFASGIPWSKPAAQPFAAPLVDQRMALASAPTLVSQAREMPASYRVTAANSNQASPKPAAPALPPSTERLVSQRAAAKERPMPAERPTRQALARYDGPHSLSVRSAASGRHYRFEHPGQTQVIDAMDIALMRRIEDITLL
jgi:hypothetical protein